MTKKQIRLELDKICKIMKSWRDINRKIKHIIPKDEVHRRELVLIAQLELCKLDDAKEFGDKLAEGFHGAIYGLLKKFIMA